MSHYLMDSLFDINPENKPNNSNKKKDNRRVRIFDAIRDHDWMPFREHMDDFIKAVDAYQIKGNQTPLKGTADLFFSKFWTLMEPAEIGLVMLREFLVECMNRMGMLTESESMGNPENLIFGYLALRNNRQEHDPIKFHIGLYEYLLKEIIGPIPDSLDKLALLGAMLREAYYAGRLDFCLLLNQAYNTVLDNLTNSDLIPKQHKEDFWKLATQRVLGSFFQQKAQYVKSYSAMLNSLTGMESPAGLLLSEHDLVFWGRGSIEREMQGRIGDQRMNRPASGNNPLEQSVAGGPRLESEKIEHWIKMKANKSKEKM